MPQSLSYISIPIVDGASCNLTVTDNVHYYYVSGTAVLTSNWSITVGAGAIAGMRCYFQCSPNVTLGGNHIYVLGAQVPDVLATKNFDASAYHNGTAWTVRFFLDAEEVGIVTTDDLADDCVTNDKLANITRGSIKVGGAADAPTDLVALTAGRVLMGNGTDVVSLPISQDATLAGTGALTIVNGVVTNAKLAAMVRGTVKVGGAGNVATDLTANTNAQILIGNGVDIISVPITGDITIDNTGLVTVVGIGPWENGVAPAVGSAQLDNAVTGCTATGNYSVSAGFNSTASGNFSLSIGNTCVASAAESVSLGWANTSSGIASFTCGLNNTASNQGAFSTGSANVSSGIASFTCGASNTASGTNSFSCGSTNTSSAANTFTGGSGCVSSTQTAFSFGESSTASGRCSVAIGTNAVANLYGSYAIACGRFNIDGDAQLFETILKIATTNNVADNMQLEDGTDGITIPTDCTMNVYVRVVAVQTGGVAGTIGDSFSQIIKFACNNIAGVSAVVPTAAITLANYDVEAGDILYEIPFVTAAFAGTVAVSVAANKIQVTVTGENNKNIQWIAHVSIVMTGYRNFVI